MKILVVDNKNDGKKLNSFILNNFRNLNINLLYKALRKKDIRVNGVRVSNNIIIHKGDEIAIYISDELLLGKSSFVEFNRSFIIYEDSNILVLNKPSELEVLGENSLTSIAINYLGYEIFPCHRLDRNTSGLVLFAKTLVARDILFNKFKKHEIEKHYACIVYGIPKKSHDTLTAFLFKDSKSSMVYVKDQPQKAHQKIITEYRIISSNKNSNTSVLDVTLHTGRTHQIRAHLAHIGHPIIGDGKYGINEVNKVFKVKYQQLCSYSLKFKFTTDSQILNYLNNMEIKIDNPFSSI